MNRANIQTRIQLLLYFYDEAEEKEIMYRDKKNKLSKELVELEVRLHNDLQ